MDSLSLAFSSLFSALAILIDFWWIWIPFLLIITVWAAIEHYNALKYLLGLKWVLLEIRVPQEAHKSLNAMEQVFTALHSPPFPAKGFMGTYRAWKSRFLEGKVQDWLTFEIVGIGGEIHFYVRVLEKAQETLQAQIYAHYPDSEITPVSDYLVPLPISLPTDVMEIGGVELELAKDSAYPLKTYPEFEEEGAGKDDVKRIDPLAPLIEFMAGLQPGEYMGIQISIRGCGDRWIKEGQKVIDKLAGKPEKPAEANFIEKGFRVIDGFLLPGPAAPAADKKEGTAFNQLSPGTQDLIKAMEHGFTKHAFESGLRVVYISPKDRFKDNRIGAVSTAFKQFTSQSFNAFKPAFSTTVLGGFNKPKKTLHNKYVLYNRYRSRAFPKKPFVLTTEELTTLWHFPDIGVKSPAVPRVEAKKGEAPSGLPTI